RTVVLTLGTALGVALVVRKEIGGEIDVSVTATELGNRRGTDGDRSWHLQLGSAQLRPRPGEDEDAASARWVKGVQDAVHHFRRLLRADRVILGGGQAQAIRDFRSVFPDETVTRSPNDDVFVGGERVW